MGIEKQALSFERTGLGRVRHVERVSRPYIAKGLYKSIDKLNGLQLLLYVLKRYSFELVVILCVLGWAVAFSGWIAA
jgi:hypothetical protein